MKKKSIIKRMLSIFLIIICGCQSNIKQESQTTNTKENRNVDIETNIKVCVFSTKNEPKSQRVNMELPYPCEWQINNGKSENVIKKFIKVNKDGSAIEEMLVITNIDMNLTDSDISKLLSKENLTASMDLEKDKSISTARLSINGYPSTKMVYETSINNQISSKVVQYIIVHKKYLIRIQFATMSSTSIQANSLYDENQNLFSKIASDIKFYDN